MRITDHALVRYIDRSLHIGVEHLRETMGIEGDRNVLAFFAQDCRVDVDAWRRELQSLANLAQSEAPCERGYFWRGGLGFVVDNESLITVLVDDKRRRPPRMRRARKKRYPAVIAKLSNRHGRVVRRKAKEQTDD